MDILNFHEVSKAAGCVRVNTPTAIIPCGPLVSYITVTLPALLTCHKLMQRPTLPTGTLHPAAHLTSSVLATGHGREMQHRILILQLPQQSVTQAGKCQYYLVIHRGIFQRNLGLRGWWVDWVRDIVLNMHGQDLTALKNAMDDGGDAHNIHKLIYNDILVCASLAQLWSGICIFRQCVSIASVIRMQCV